MLKYLFYLLVLIYIILYKMVLNIVDVFLGVMFLMMIYFFGMIDNWAEVGSMMGVDKVSLFLIMLTVIIFYFVMFDYSGNLYGLGYNFILVFMIFFLVILFSIVDLFTFYLVFEASLIPIFLIIMGWGAHSERLGASIYLMMYMLVSSLPMMIVLMFLNHSLFYMKMIYMEEFTGKMIVYFLVVLMFAVKFPLFILHLWLPSAHVEAPVGGSMILAGILLKLGGYGLYRFMKLIYYMGMNLNVMFIVVSLVGMFLVSLNCLCQVDIKSLVAYSSVVHMCVSLLGIMSLSMWGLSGFVVLMISHGLCSSGLFYLIGVVYHRFMSRSLYLSKGLMICMPSMGLGWFLLSVSNLSAPPSLNLLGELMVLGGLLYWSLISLLILIFIMFFSAFYSLYMFSYLHHGDLYGGSVSGSLNSGMLSEYLVVYYHFIPLNVIFLMGDLFN
uniref:NADH-ubiquinone oxidoreductase chain 4 n=1 Tax=Aposthonia borneensis TaxID=1208762 RepID=A0A678QWX9_9NEOP|nr:NADH dehydrogenase subunit 4 [Aposthonia borneensis]